MGSQRVFVEFDNFLGGESGTLTGPNAPTNSFNGVNVVPFIDGSLGPRCGLLNVSPASGVSNGKISAFGIVHRDLDADFFYVQGNRVYQWAVGGALSDPYDGAFDSPPTRPCAVVSRNGDSEHFITVNGQGTYRINHLAQTMSKITGSPGGDCIAIYGTRLLVGAVGDSGILPSRIQFSGSDEDDGDFDAWDPLNYLNIPGDTGLRIRGMYPMRDYLLIVRKGGELWRLSGVPGVNDTLRQVSGAEPSFTAYQDTQGIVTNDNRFWCVGLASTAPRVFNGGSLKAVPHLGTENVTSAVSPYVWTAEMAETDVLPPQYGAVSAAPDSVSFFGRNKGLILRHGAWSKHVFDADIAGWAAAHTNGAVFLSDGGADDDHPEFYWLNTGDDRPPIKEKGVRNRDSLGDNGDNAPDCHFSTNEWWDKQGRRVQVRGVIVNFTEQDTNNPDGQNDNFDISVTSIDRLGDEPETTSAVQSWNSDPTPLTFAGIRRRKVFGFADQGLGQGFRLNVGALRGIRIHSLTAVVDITEGSPV